MLSTQFVGNCLAVVQSGHSISRGHRPACELQMLPVLTHSDQSLHFVQV